MRRSAAPSVRGIGGSFRAHTGFKSPPPSSNNALRPVNSNVSLNDNDSSSSSSRYFTVIWCKLSGRKHKKWEEDALLMVRPESRLAILRSAVTGKEIARGGAGMKISELTELESGKSISFGGKEIEILDELSKTGFDDAVSRASKECEKDKSEEKELLNIPIVKSKPLPFRNRFVCLTKRPLYSLDSPNSLVMPRPGPEDILRRKEGKEEFKDEEVVDVIVDPHLSRELRPHQRTGVIFLYNCVMGFKVPGFYGAILADEMGLGKTLQTITVIWTLLRQGPWNNVATISRCLILCPSSLVRNWAAEFTKWLGCERIRVFAVDSSSNRFGEYLKRPNEPIVIMSYEMFIRCYDQLCTLNFGLLVADEGHRLKNSSVKASTMIQSINIQRRIVLTGTPVQNDLKEFYALTSIVNPEILGSLNEFSRNYETPIIRGKQPDSTPEEIEESQLKMEELNHRTGQFILRRTMEAIRGYLPPKTENILFCRPSATQLRMYRNVLDRIGNDYSSGECVLSTILDLRKICNHPSLFSDEQLEETFEELGSKLGTVSSMLYELKDSKEKIVLVSISTQVLDLLEELCNHYEYPYLRLDGSTSASNRQTIVSRFNDKRGKDFVLLLSSKAGGTGLNLIGGSRILLYDMDWNPAHDAQAMARVWRDGQTKPVFIYRLVTTGTIEEKIFQRQITKQGLGDGVVDDNSVKSHFSKEDLKDLFTLSTDLDDCDTHRLIGCQCLIGKTRSDSSETNAIIRGCQLGARKSANGNQISSRNEGNIKDLLKWTHLRPSSEINEDSLILAVSEFLTFVFQNKVK